MKTLILIDTGSILALAMLELQFEIEDAHLGSNNDDHDFFEGVPVPYHEEIVNELLDEWEDAGSPEPEAWLIENYPSMRLEEDKDRQTFLHRANNLLAINEVLELHAA